MVGHNHQVRNAVAGTLVGAATGAAIGLRHYYRPRNCALGPDFACGYPIPFGSPGVANACKWSGGRHCGRVFADGRMACRLSCPLMACGRRPDVSGLSLEAEASVLSLCDYADTQSRRLRQPDNLIMRASAACHGALNFSSSRRTASYIAGVGSSSDPSMSLARPLKDPLRPANFLAAALSPCCFAFWYSS